LRALANWLLAPPGAEVPDGSGAWREVFNVIYQSGRVQSSSQHHLSAALERFQRAAEAIPDGIVMLNEGGQIEWCNPVAETPFDVSNQRDHLQRIAYLGRHFQLMLDQTRRMQGLVDDLLTLSRLESTQEKMSEEVVDVCALLQILYKEALSLSDGRHHLHLELDADCKLLGNVRDLHSAFGNLVSNAVRYTPEGGEIVLRWALKGAEARFCVQDSGIGIEPQYISRLTERFYRVDRGRSRETGGTGLGLSIVKHILTRHQGRLEISSEPGKGSLFCACFPARRVIEQEKTN
jgi:signal transduction histidine kinase